MESYKPVNDTSTSWGQIVVGDFNIYPDSLGPTNFLTGKDVFHSQRGDLRDVWETIEGKTQGYTFSNLQGRDWTARADRILLRGPPLVEQIVERKGYRNETNNIAASDHIAVLTHINFNPSQNCSLGENRVICKS